MLQFAKLLIGPISSWFAGRKDTKDKTLAATQAWEASMGRSMENGWKDEYVTVVVTLPLVQSFVGNLVYAITGKSQILDAQALFMADLGAMMETPYGDLMLVVVLAAVGIKGLKALR